MNCNEFEIAVENAIEGRTGLDPLALQHAGYCQTCRDEWERQQTLDVAIRAWKSVQPSADLTAAVLSELERTSDTDLDCLKPITGSEEADLRKLLNAPLPIQPLPAAKPAKQPARGAHWVLLSLVSCLVVAILFAQQFSRKDAGQNRDDMANVDRDQGTEIADASLSRDYSETVSEVISEMKVELNGIATETSAVVDAIADAMSTRAPAGQATTENDTDGFPKSGEAARVWQPIGSRVKTALGFLLLALPGERPKG
jgi:hypothetical protein